MYTSAVSIVSVGVATLIWIGVWWSCWWCPLPLSHYSLEVEEQGRVRQSGVGLLGQRDSEESEWIFGGKGYGRTSGVGMKNYMD